MAETPCPSVLRRGDEAGSYRVEVDGKERGVVYRTPTRRLNSRKAGHHGWTTVWTYSGADEAWDTRAEAVEALLQNDPSGPGA